jgi:hypothetical protein
VPLYSRVKWQPGCLLLHMVHAEANLTVPSPLQVRELIAYPEAMGKLSGAARKAEIRERQEKLQKLIPDINAGGLAYADSFERAG